MESKNRIKLRAHHLLGEVLIEGNKENQAYRKGVSGQQMYERQSELIRLTRSNPDLEVEITDDFDDLCSACPRGPNKVRYVRPQRGWSFNKKRNPQYWAKQEQDVWKKPCERGGSINLDKKWAEEDMGLPIGTVIIARQAIKITEIWSGYMQNLENFRDHSIYEVQDAARKELEKFYRSENIQYKFSEPTFPSAEDMRATLKDILARRA